MTDPTLPITLANALLDDLEYINELERRFNSPERILAGPSFKLSEDGETFKWKIYGSFDEDDS